MADARPDKERPLSTNERLGGIEAAMIYFNRRQNEDIALSQEMRLDFIQEFRELKTILVIGMIVVAFMVVAAAFV